MTRRAREPLFPLTEAGDAEFFAQRYGDRVRYDHRRGRWLVFVGHRWIPDDDGELRRLALKSMRQRQQAALAIEDQDRRQNTARWALGGESRRRIENMLELAKNLPGVADSGDGWDADPWLLAVQNGVVDLRSGRLRPGAASDRITMSARVEYSPSAQCPLWERTIDEILGGDRELIDYIHRALGYSISGDCREECLMLCWGDGRNGKGTLLNAVAWLLGEYADDLPFSALELTERSGISNDIAKLVGKRFATASESSDTVRLNEARIKAMTGRDPITARFLHREYFTFVPVAKFWLSTNHKPVVRDDSEGFWRRLHFIPFAQSFAGRENRELKDRLRAEAPGILTWLVRGCRDWQQHGLNAPAAVRTATEEYRRESEPLSPFFDSCCVITPGGRVKAFELYTEYLRWADAGGMAPGQRLNQTSFGTQVRKRFIAEEKRHVVTYYGIALAGPVGPLETPFSGFPRERYTREKTQKRGHKWSQRGQKSTGRKRVRESGARRRRRFQRHSAAS